MNLSKRISHRERIFIRTVTISAKLRGRGKLSKKVLKNPLMQASHQDENLITIDKINAAKKTNEQCYSYLSNPYVFFPNNFKVQVARRLLSSSILSQLNELSEKTEEEELKRDIVETLTDSDVPMCCLDKDNQHLKEASVLLCKGHSRIVERGSDDKNNAVRDQTIQACNELLEKTRVSSLVSCLKYEANIAQGAVKHQNLGTVFCTALLYIQDSYTGRLHIENTDLQEIFLTGERSLYGPSSDT